MLRIFRRRRTHKRRKSGHKYLRIWLLLLAVLFIGGSIFSELGLSSVSPELTEEAARNYIQNAINEAVYRQDTEEIGAYVEADRNAAGKVLSLSCNTTKLNALKAEIMERLSESLNKKAKVHVPIGSLSNVALFNGRGFLVPIHLQFEGTADVSFQSEFLSAGLNQSCHRITMTVKAGVYVPSQRFETAVTEETTTVLAETVIVGEVPEIAAAFPGMES